MFAQASTKASSSSVTLNYEIAKCYESYSLCYSLYCVSPVLRTKIFLAFTITLFMRTAHLFLHSERIQA